MPKDPRIKALANVAAVKIKALTDIHHQQIEAIYQEFQQAVAIIESNADELQTHSATPTQPTESDQQENHHDTK